VPVLGERVPRQIVHRGRKIEVALETSVLPDGETVERDLILHPGAVAILPLLDDGHVCLVRNLRPNVGETLWEIPAGTLEAGEAPAAAAVRELAEETGYTAASWRKLAEFFPSSFRRRESNPRTAAAREGRGAGASGCHLGGSAALGA
jgi:ADP-ribose pyrophosphatase